MQPDIEHVNFDELDDAGKVEYGTILQANYNQVVLQLITGKEPVMAEILSAVSSLRLSERFDLLTRLSSFCGDLLRIAIIDRRKELLTAQIAIAASEEAKKNTETPIIDEEGKEN